MSEHGGPQDEHIEVEVENLDFEGLVVREPARVQLAFQSELGRLLRERGLPSTLGEHPAGIELDGGTLDRNDITDPERLGRAVAARVYEELAR